MGLNIDDSVKTNKPIRLNKKKNNTSQADKTLNT